MQSPPSSKKRIRLTISVPENVHEAYRYMSDVTGRSIGMEMGEWLDATLLAAVDMTHRIEIARGAPREAVQQLTDLTAALVSVERVRRSAVSGSSVAGEASAERPALRQRPIPPPSNTGGKPPKQHSRARPK